MEEILIELRKINDRLALIQPVLSFEQFCLFADLSTDYVRKLQKEGKIPFTRPFGRKLYISRENAIRVLLQNPISSEQEIGKQANNHFIKTKQSLL